MLWLFVILALILLWVIPAFRTLQEMEGQPAPRWRIPFLHLIDEPEEAAIVFVLLGISIAVGGYAFLYGLGTLRDIVGDFYANIAAEAISIAITVLIIERLYERRSKTEAEKAEKERLILQMGSPDRGFAVEAARQLAKREWLKDGSLVKAHLGGADLTEAKLYEANLSDANLYKTILDNAILARAVLTGADFWRASLKGAMLIEATLHRAILRDVELSNAYLRQADLSSAILWEANLSGSDLLGCILIDAGMSKANLHGANLSHANLSGAYLGDANLIKANLLGANLSETDLSSAIYDYQTQWPEGFDPKLAGAIEVDEESGEWIPVDKKQTTT